MNKTFPALICICGVFVSCADETAASSQKAEEQSSPKAKHTVDYTVKKGDTVAIIARKFGSSIKTVRGATGLSSGVEVKPGQTVRIPMIHPKKIQN